jgi:hypothetical protein
MPPVSSTQTTIVDNECTHSPDIDVHRLGIPILILDSTIPDNLAAAALPDDLHSLPVSLLHPFYASMSVNHMIPPNGRAHLKH